MDRMDCSSENLESPVVNDNSKMENEEKDIPAKKRKPRYKKKISKLGGVKIDRFRFLLKQGYPFKTAIQGATKYSIVELVASSVALAATERRSREDPWMFEKLHHDDKGHYSRQFRKSFATLIEQGESLKDAWTLAKREADTRTVLESQNGVCDPKSFEGKIRVIICHTNHPEEGITTENFRILLAEMRTNLAKIIDIRYIPHLLECRLVPGTGYILAICGDAITVRWIRLTLKWMTLWPGASVLMVREKKFLESRIMTVCIPDGIARTSDSIMKQLKKQNCQVEIDKWSVLTTKDLTKQKLNKLTVLVPLKDCQELEATNMMLDYLQTKVKLVAPEDRTKIGKRALFRGIFGVPSMVTDEVFKIIADENEGIAVTDEWTLFRRNNYNISFFVDPASAAAIRAADHIINFQSKTIRLVCMERVSEV